MPHSNPGSWKRIEDAKTFIQWLRREGYTSADRVERSLPSEAYVWLNWDEVASKARSVQPIS